MKIQSLCFGLSHFVIQTFLDTKANKLFLRIWGCVTDFNLCKGAKEHRI